MNSTRLGVAMLLLCMACHSLALAQLPQLKIDEEEVPHVYLSQLKVDVKIAGNLAITTMEMTFRNNSPRILEGELVFPLPEGVSVSRYALDINGHMREAVPVEKTKATQVFEEIEHRRVDPGLLEKVEGNNFRTRIYPLPANGIRTILLAYEEELLSNGKKQLRYHLPLDHKKAVDQFKLDIAITQSPVRPEWEEQPDAGLQLQEWNNNYTASITKENYIPARSLTLVLPKMADQAEVMMQETGGHYYFLVNCFPQKNTRTKNKVHELTLIWDASLSGLNRDIEKELQLLGSYLAYNENTKVHLYLLNNTYRHAGDFTIDNGQWADLKRTLEKVNYDGGTNYSRIHFPASEEYLFFTDGLSSLSREELQLPGKPVYTITSAPRSNFSQLQYIARKTGGISINLEALKVNEAENLLLKQPLQFIGIKPNRAISETYPSLPQPINGHFSLAGMVTEPQATVVLQFGYGATVITEKSIALNFRQQPSTINLARVWAQKKIGELDIHYDENAALITFLGKQHGIVTRNTSLLVLETLQDYVQYEVEPPADLRKEYDRLIKQQLVRRENSRRVTLANALAQLNTLQIWWKRNFVPQVLPREHKEMHSNSADTMATVSTAHLYGSRGPVNSTGMPGAASRQETRRRNDHADRERAASQDQKAAENTHQQPRSNTASPPSSNHLQEVVVIGYGTQKRSSMTGSVATVQAHDLAAAPPTNVPEGRMAGVAVSNRNKAHRTNHEPALSSIDIKQWTPERSYLHSLAKEKAGNRYAAYLSLRKDYLYTPTFYYDVGTFFLREKDTLTGLQILTNMAEVDLENHELYKLLGYKLRETGAYEEALAIFHKILQWRPQEPHSYRDYGLALADAGKYQEALDTLYAALEKNYSEQIADMYSGIEEIIVTEINQLITRHKDQLNLSRIDPKLIQDMPTDVRVVLNWNKNDTDMDLWVTDPNQETCYYGHKETLIGGRISDDFTSGYGPEQFLLKKATPGKYQVKVNYYGDQQFKFSGPTTVLAEIYTHYASGRQERKLITLQMEKQDRKEGILVGEFHFGGEPLSQVKDPKNK